MSNSKKPSNSFKKLGNFLGWDSSSRNPEYNLNPQIYEQLKPFRLPLVIIQITMIIGTLGYVYIEDYSIMHAIFQAAYTFSTTGFGALNEGNFSNAGIIFTVTLIIVGFAVLTFSVGVLLRIIAEGTLFRLLKERSMLYKIARLRNHFVVFYHNEYTAQLAKQFRANHIPFVVVDPDPNLEQIAKENKYPYFIQEEPYIEKAFLKSHLSSAKGVISLSKNMSNNITIIASIRLYEKELGRKPYLIICNAETNNDIEKLKKLGADKVVAPPALMAKRVSAMAIRPDMENVLEEFLYKKDTPIDMEEIEIRDNSWMVGREIKEAHLRDNIKVSVIGINGNKWAIHRNAYGNGKNKCRCKTTSSRKSIKYSKSKKTFKQT